MNAALRFANWIASAKALDWLVNCYDLGSVGQIICQKAKDKRMNQFAVPKVYQAKPSKLKKKVALAAFIIGAVSFTLAVTGVVGPGNGVYFFAGGIPVMAFAFRFWNMQVRNPTRLTFKAEGVEIAQRSSGETIPWAELESIRYRVWQGGHFWEFRVRGRKQTLDYYVDGLGAQLEELRQTISAIELPGLLIQTSVQPGDVAKVVAGQTVLGVGRG